MSATKKLADHTRAARDLLLAARKDDSSARQRLRKYFPSLRNWSPIQARYIIAREAGFTGWPALREYLGK